MKSFSELLQKLNACDDAVEWIGDKSIEQAVNECHRGDWMLWLADRLEIDDRKMTLAKAHCANTVRHLMKDQRSIKAVDIAIMYGEGIATKEELRAATSAAADAAIAASTATYAAESAANAAAYAAANAAIAAAYASAAADAAAADTGVASAAARKKSQIKTADICRKYIGQDIIEKVNELLLITKI